MGLDNGGFGSSSFKTEDVLYQVFQKKNVFRLLNTVEPLSYGLFS